MSAYWVIGLVVLVVASAVAALLWARRRDDARDTEAIDHVDLPLWDAQEHTQRDFWPELVERNHDETMPAVLTPPEWRTPPSGTEGR